MTSKRHMILRSAAASLLALVLASACGGDTTKDGGKKADAGKTDAGKQADAGKTDAGKTDAEDAGEVPALDPKVDKAVTIANDIAADPAKADEILEAAGMDRESFEALLYEIARDPELSKAYVIARMA